MEVGKWKYYKCVWCQHTFKAWATYIQGESSQLSGTKGKKGSCSSQIKCPKCQNFNPTWNVKYIDGKKFRMDRR